MRLGVFMCGIAATAGVAGPASAEATAEQMRQIDAVFARWQGSTTPGCAISVVHRGTTAAAITVMRDGGFDAAIANGLTAASKAAAKLGDPLQNP